LNRAQYGNAGRRRGGRTSRSLVASDLLKNGGGTMLTVSCFDLVVTFTRYNSRNHAALFMMLQQQQSVLRSVYDQILAVAVAI